jgi:hypothetical protein
MTFTRAQVEQYHRDGFIVERRLFSEAELAPLRDAVDEVLGEVRQEAIAAGRDPEGLFSSGVYVGLSLRRELFRKTARHPRLLDNIEALIGKDIGFLSDKVAFKGKGVTFNSPWHQDWSYWGGSHKISVWIALDAATPENGCLQLLPGSHLKPIDHDHVNVPQGFGNRLDLANRGFDPSKVVTTPAEPGDAVYFHDLTLHASLPNKTGEDRRALIITYRDLSQPDREYPSLAAAARVRG